MPAEHTMDLLAAGFFILIVAAVCCLVAGLLFARGAPFLGGTAAPHSVVVDTLNLVHWGHRRPGDKVRLDDITGAIDRAAAPLRKMFPGRVYFVVKSRDRRPTEAERERVHTALEDAARRNRVFVAIAERLSAPPRSAKKGHAEVGRDDFYAAVLAARHGWPVLSRDRFRDLAAMKDSGLEAFHVWIFSPYAPPSRDFVDPASGFRRLRRPERVDFGDVPGLEAAFA